MKTFFAEIINDHQMLIQEQAGYKNMPVISDVKQKEILENYLQIKKDVQAIIESEIETMLDSSELNSFIMQK